MFPGKFAGEFVGSQRVEDPVCAYVIGDGVDQSVEVAVALSASTADARSWRH